MLYCKAFVALFAIFLGFFATFRVSFASKYQNIGNLKSKEYENNEYLGCFGNFVSCLYGHLFLQYGFYYLF